MSAPVIALVVAVARNGVIGKDGTLPWRIPEDMKWFKARTLGKPCIMGRKTWESLPKRPLPERTNIVVTRNPGYRADGAAVAATIDLALDIAWGEAPEEIMVIGGAELYRAALPWARRIYLTRVEADSEGDTYFPPFAPEDWLTTIAAAHSASPERPIGYSFQILDRK
ncbi:MAG: dihydrofolate reductase [Alphaproteobacteria bacterium]|nr:dihydrofolate reductase [Alphaproteobacteria bacterium]